MESFAPHVRVFQPLLSPLRSCRGLTLVEIITTLVIIAISAMFAAPEILNWRANMRVSSSARDLYTVLNSARVSAVEQNRNIIVTIAANTVTTSVDDGAGGGTIGDNIYQVGETLLNTLSFNANINGRDYRDAHIHAVTITAPRGFTPRGISIAGNTGEIRIRNANSDRWFKIAVSGSGSLSLLQSNDSTDGSNGTWN
jgi:type IV fimbrial biogenesis protein FimT